MASFLLAYGLTSSVEWFRLHYPYLGYFIASLGTSYVADLWAANLVAVLSAGAVYLTFSPAGFFVASTQTPLTAASAVLFLFIACNWLIGSMKLSRDKLEAERERYARLAESRDVLYRELQHRVSNNIQIIAGLLMLQSQAVGDKAAKRALGEASARIGLIARIQRQLHDRTGEPTPFRRFAEELLADAVGAAGADGVQVEVTASDVVLDPEQATPVSLVMLECVNNALEHAFAPGQAGRVTVSLEPEGERMVLTVADNGRGLPEGFDPATGQSLGLKIVRTMAGQIGGKFSITPAEPGAVARLRFPRP